MVRKFCVLLILLYSFNCNVKCVYSLPNLEHSLDMINSILKTVQMFAGHLKKIFHNKKSVDTPLTSPAPEDDNENIDNPNNLDYYIDRQILLDKQTLRGFTDIDETTSFIISESSTDEQLFVNTKEIRTDKQVSGEFNAIQLITLAGYKAESHTVVTSDGYVLTLQRILQENDNPTKHAVILHHGLFGSSEDWLLLGPGLALPFLLTDRGYDVWLLNARGNKYSKGHTTWSTDSYDFWDFSWHEMGIYDLPATIMYINERTYGATLYFVGHSMGASALLALLSTNPEYNEKLKAAFFLAPLAFMHHTKGPMKLFSDIRQKNGKTALNFLGTNEFLPTGEFPKTITKKYCKGNKKFCLNPVLLLANGGETTDEDVIESLPSRASGGGSAMTILHYVQLVKNRRFQMYDYGMQDNLNKYKQKRPPRYNLELITLSISLFTSPSDWLASTSDVVTLLSRLKNIYIHHIIRRIGFSHMDFVWAKDAPELVFNPLLQNLEQMESTNFNVKDKHV